MTDPPEPATVPRAMAPVDVGRLLKLRESLERYARRLLQSSPLQGPIGQTQPTDFAAAAIMSAIENLAGKVTTRRWDPDRCSMATFCRGHVRSSISNARNSTEMQIGVDIGGDVNFVADESYNPVELLSLKQQYMMLLRSLDNKPFVQNVLILMLEDESNTTAIIANRLSCDLSVVENARRTIYRHGRKIAGEPDAKR